MNSPELNRLAQVKDQSIPDSHNPNPHFSLKLIAVILIQHLGKQLGFIIFLGGIYMIAFLE